jgi:hypothetical protein
MFQEKQFAYFAGLFGNDIQGQIKIRNVLPELEKLK